MLKFYFAIPRIKKEFVKAISIKKERILKNYHNVSCKNQIFLFQILFYVSIVGTISSLIIFISFLYNATTYSKLTKKMPCRNTKAKEN